VRRAIAALAAGLAAAGCGGGGGVGLAAATLGLPVGTSPAAALGTATLFTSPDGGIYRNPDHLDVVLAGGADATGVAARLGTAAAWAPLARLGRFTAIGLRLRDDGKVGSDPGFADLQVASDLAPDGTSSGPLRHFYHPTWPLAMVADRPIDGDCQLHLDPGQTATVVLLYPPVRATPSLVWGRYQDFALTLRRGGAVPAPDGDLRAAACTPPEPPA